jgi:hypothetical protein
VEIYRVDPWDLPAASRELVERCERYTLSRLLFAPVCLDRMNLRGIFKHELSTEP